MYIESEMVYSTLNNPRRDRLARRCALQQKILHHCQQLYHILLLSHFFLPRSTEPPVPAKTSGCVASCYFSLSSGISLHFTTKTVTSVLRPTVTAPCHLPVAIFNPLVSLGAFCRGTAAFTKGVTAAHTDSTCSSTCTAMEAVTANLH